MRDARSEDARTPRRPTSRDADDRSIMRRARACGGARPAGAAGVGALMPATCRAGRSAARTTRSSSASARRELARSIRPSCITSTRSAIPSTSGSSDEIISTARPWPGELGHQAVHLGLGADVDAARRLVDDQHLRARWPATWRARPSAGCRPTGSRPGRSSRWNFSCSLVAQSRGQRASAAGRITPSLCASACRRVRPMLRSMRELHHQALLAAVLGHEADAGPHRRARRAAAGAAGRRPRRGRRPARSMPKIARATSLRPAPTRPASATISPRRTSKETSMNTPSRVSRSTSSTVDADLGVLLREQRATARGRPCGAPARRASCRRSARRARPRRRAGP